MVGADNNNNNNNSNKEVYDGFKQYWFPFRPVASADLTLSTQRQIENLINVRFYNFVRFFGELEIKFWVLKDLENEYCKNLKQVGNEAVNKCESIQLIRIYSPHLLPIKFGFLKTATTLPKLFYYLCVLDEASKLNYLRERFDDHPNKIRNDNLNDSLRWMDYAQLKQAQLTYNLMGLEPLLFYKQFLAVGGGASNGNGSGGATGGINEDGGGNNKLSPSSISSNLAVSTSIETILFEPVLTYFPLEQTEAVTSAEQLIVAAKFNKTSKILEFI